MSEVKLKDITNSNIPEKIKVDDKPKVGGEGRVFFSKDGKYAIKIYNENSTDRENLLKKIMVLFKSLPIDQKKFILPPLALVDTFNGSPATGFIMDKVSSDFDELIFFISSPKQAAKYFMQNYTWAHYLRLARSVTNALVVLHGKGCAHTDIHFRNFLVNIASGEAVMLEMDGVVVKGFLPPQVMGMVGFMAPEILINNESPSERTDRHSLAVLILYTLLFRNPLNPLRDYADDPRKSEILGWGEKAVFSEHPTDTRNRLDNIGVPLYNRGALSYKMLPVPLQKLAERALIDGLFAPEKRPSSREWEEALANGIDELCKCQNCNQYFPYPYWISDYNQRTCPFCGVKINYLPLVFEEYEKRYKNNYSFIGRRLVLSTHHKIFDDMILPNHKPPFSRKNSEVVGEIIWTGRKYGILNKSSEIWKVKDKRGNIKEIKKNQSTELNLNDLIQFGENNRIFKVIQTY